MQIFLERDTHNEFGTFGTLLIGKQKLYTVEQDWENNKPNLSCIPNGDYIVTFHQSPHHGECYILENLALQIGKDQGDAKRFGCLFHVANLASQLEGCIAPGKHRSYYKDSWSVSSSGAAMDEMFELLGKNPNSKHKLTISSNFPTFEIK